MKKAQFTLLLLYLFFSFSVFSTDSKRVLDSICKSHVNQSNSVLKEALLNHVSLTYNQNKFESFSLIEEILRYAKNNNFYEYEVKVLQLLAGMSLENGRLSDNIRYQMEALEKCNRYNLPNEYRIITFLKLSQLFKSYNLVELSKEYADFCFDILNKNELTSEEDIENYLDLIFLYIDFKEFNKSLSLINKVKISNKYQENISEKFIFLNVYSANAYNGLKNNKQRDNEINTALLLIQDTLFYKTPFILFVINTYSCFLTQDFKFKEAILSLENQMELTNGSSEFLKWKAIINRDLALNYKAINNLKLAKLYALKYYEISKENKFEFDIQKSLELLYLIHEDLNQKEIAFEYLSSLKKNNDTSSKTNKIDYIYKLVNKYYIESKDEFNKSLLIEKQDKEKQLIEKDIKINFFILIFSVLIIFGSAILYLFFQNKNNLSKLKIQAEATNEKGILLESQNEKLLLLNSEIQNITNAVTHDLKSPLNRIEALIGIIRQEPTTNSQSKELMNVALKEIYGAKELISNILQTAENSNNNKHENQDFDVSETVKMLISAFEIEAGKKSIKIFKSISPHIRFFGNKSELERIASNLISNAIKFSNSGKNIHVTVEDFGQKFKIGIKDEGLGISEADQLKMFNKFTKLNNIPTANENSTGLGLYITKQLVDGMDGKIFVDSTVGIGTTIEVLLKKNIS